MSAISEPIFRRICIAFAAAALTAAAAPSVAQPRGLPDNYPHKPIRVLVGSAPGGGADTLARLVSRKLSDAFGHPFAVENVPSGVGGLLALNALHASPPDGYTIGNSSGSTFQGATYQHKVEYDVRKAFMPVAQFTVSPQYLAFYPNAPFKTVKELIAYAKANPGKVNYGSSGIGSGAHLLGEMLNFMGGIKMTHIPYKGAGQSMVDAMAGRIQVVFGSQTAITPHARSGKLRGIGITSKQRMTTQPDVPTIAELGLPDFDYVGWIGWVAPAGTPKAIVNALNAEVNKVTGDPDVRRGMVADGSNPVAISPEEFGRNIDTALTLVGDILKKSGISLGR